MIACIGWSLSAAGAVTAASTPLRLHRMRRETYADLDLRPMLRLRAVPVHEIAVQPLVATRTCSRERRDTGRNRAGIVSLVGPQQQSDLHQNCAQVDQSGWHPHDQAGELLVLKH